MCKRKYSGLQIVLEVQKAVYAANLTPAIVSFVFMWLEDMEGSAQHWVRHSGLTWKLFKTTSNLLNTNSAHLRRPGKCLHYQLHPFKF